MVSCQETENNIIEKDQAGLDMEGQKRLSGT